MATTNFLLDPRVLDDCVSDSVPDEDIAAKAFAYFQRGEHSQPNYTFYLQSDHNNFASILAPILNSAILSLRSLDIFNQKYDGHHGDLSLRFQRANVIFMPFSDGARYQWGSPIHEFRERYLRRCEVLYVQGKFLKGDAKVLKNYGVKIK